jgi:predicted transcriptional regulator
MPNQYKEALIEQGRKNTLKLLAFLEKHKYSTTPILQKLIGLSRQGIYGLLKRLELKNLIKIHKYKNAMGSMNLIGIRLDGLSVLASARYDNLPESATQKQKDDILDIKESRCFNISKFKYSQMNHTLTIQNVHADLANRNYDIYGLSYDIKITKIITASENGHALKKSIAIDKKTLPDLIVHTKDHGNIACEIELTTKSAIRYKNLVARHEIKVQEGSYAYVFYFVPKNLKSIKHKIMKYASNENQIFYFFNLPDS